MKDRHYSFSIPWCTDAAVAFLQTAVPLLAIRYGATSLKLGTVNVVGQAFRLPVSLTAGRLSEKVGRSWVMIPASVVLVFACFALTQAKSYGQIVLFYSIGITALGAFYPSLQALIADVSKHGELTKNLSWFNTGWCIGAASAGFIGSILVGIKLTYALYAGAFCGLAAIILIVFWRNSPIRRPRSTRLTVGQTEYHPPSLLLIARMGHFTAFFSFAIVRILFPELGLSLGWSEGNVAIVGSMLLYGQAAGILTSSASPWWRGKYWPQVAALGTMLVSGLAIGLASHPGILGSAFFFIGASLGITYPAALYHGMSARKKLGKNAGIHESLIAAGNIFGCLFGGIVAQRISDRAPYFLIAIVALASLIVAGIAAKSHFRAQRCVKS